MRKPWKTLTASNEIFFIEAELYPSPSSSTVFVYMTDDNFQPIKTPKATVMGYKGTQEETVMNFHCLVIRYIR